MIERSPRDFKKVKFAESGKPDLKTPLSTIAKFNGGTNATSPSLLSSFFPTNRAVGVSVGDDSITAQFCPPNPSSFISFAPKFFKFEIEKFELRELGGVMIQRIS